MGLVLSLIHCCYFFFLFVSFYSRLPDGVSGVPGVVNVNVPNGGHPSGIPESGMDTKNTQGYCQVSWWTMHWRAMKVNVR